MSIPSNNSDQNADRTRPWYIPAYEGEPDMETVFISEVFQSFKTNVMARMVDYSRIKDRRQKRSERNDSRINDGSNGSEVKTKRSNKKNHSSQETDSNISEKGDGTGNRTDAREASSDGSNSKTKFNSSRSSKVQVPESQSWRTKSDIDFEAFKRALFWKMLLCRGSINFARNAVEDRAYFTPATIESLAVAIARRAHLSGSEKTKCPKCAANPTKVFPKLGKNYFEIRKYEPLTGYDRFRRTANPGKRKYLHKESLEEMEQLLSSYDKSVDSSPESKNFYDELKGWISLSKTSSATFRGLSMSQYMLSFLLYIDEYGHCPNMAVERLVSILQHLCPTDDHPFPYYSKQALHGRGLELRSSDRAKKAPIRLPYMIQNMMLKCVHTLGGNYTYEEDLTDGILLHEAMWDTDLSFEDNYLKAKKIFDHGPLIVASKTRCESISIDEDGVPQYVFPAQDPYPYDIPDDMTEVLDKYPMLQRIIDRQDYSSLNGSSQAISSITCAVASPIFLTTAPSIRSIASQFAKADVSVTMPETELEINGVAISINPTDSDIGLIAMEIIKMLKGMESKMADVSFEAAFLRMLSSNSSGVLPLEGKERILKEFDFNNLAADFIKKKPALVGLASEILTDYDTWTEFASVAPGVTARTQVHRRPRTVVMFPLSLQMGSIHIKLALNFLAAEHDEMRVGKATGTSLDILDLVRASGDPARICASSDISGFDSRMGFPMRNFIRMEVARALGVYPKKFFWSDACRLDAKCRDGSFRKIYINAVQQVLLHYFDHIAAPETYDKLFNQYVPGSSDTLASGEFGTTGMATILLAAIAKRIQSDIESMHPKAGVQGDDQFAIFDNVPGSVEKFTKSMSKHLHSVGMSAEPFIHRDYGIFLQLGAYKGTMSSMAYRIAAITSEKPSHTDALYGFDEVDQIMGELIGRSAYPEGLITLTSVFFSNYSAIKAPTLKVDHPKVSTCLITGVKYLHLPILSFYSKVGGGYPMPTTVTSLSTISADNPFSFRGHAAYYNHFKRLFNQNVVPETGIDISPNIVKLVDDLSNYGKSKALNSMNICIDTQALHEMEVDLTYSLDEFNPRQLTLNKRDQDPDYLQISQRIEQTFKNLSLEQHQKAQNAKRFLVKENIKIPKPIDFTQNAKSKTESMILNAEQPKDIWDHIHTGLDSVLEKSLKKPLRHGHGLPMMYGLFFMFPLRSENIVTETPLIGIAPKYAISPSSLRSKYHQQTLMREGSTSKGIEADMQVVNSWVASKYMDNRSEDINHVLSQIRRSSAKNKLELVDHFASVMALPPSARTSLFKVWDNARLMAASPMKITNISRATMSLNDNLNSIYSRTCDPLITPSPETTKLMSSVAAMISRNIGHHFEMNRMKFIFPSWVPALVMHLTKIRERVD